MQEPIVCEIHVALARFMDVVGQWRYRRLCMRALTAIDHIWTQELALEDSPLRQSFGIPRPIVGVDAVDNFVTWVTTLFPYPCPAFLGADAYISRLCDTLSYYDDHRGRLTERIIKEISKSKSTVSEIVSRNGRFLHYFCDTWGDDDEIVTKAVTHSGDAIGDASPRLRDNMGMILLATKTNPNAGFIRNRRVPYTRNEILALLAVNGAVYYYIDRELRTDRDIALAAVSAPGGSGLNLLCPCDKAIALARLKWDGYAYLDLNSTLQSDKDVILAAIRNVPHIFANVRGMHTADLEIVMDAVSREGSMLKYADPSLQKDKRVVMAAVSNCGGALRYADAAVVDKEIALTAVRQDGESFVYLSQELQRNREIMMAAVRQSGSALRHMGVEFRNDPEIVLAAVAQNGNSIGHAGAVVRENLAIAVAAVRQCKFAVRHLPAGVRKSPEVVAVLEHTGHVALR